MTTQLEATKKRIAVLARETRGVRTREDLLGDSGVYMTTYADFENGDRWPRAATLRKLEAVLGWVDTSIDQALMSGMPAPLITTAHMRGDESWTAPVAPLRAYTDAELVQELAARYAEREHTQDRNQAKWDLAASRDLHN